MVTADLQLKSHLPVIDPYRHSHSATAALIRVWTTWHPRGPTAILSPRDGLRQQCYMVSFTRESCIVGVVSRSTFCIPCISPQCNTTWDILDGAETQNLLYKCTSFFLETEWMSHSHWVLVRQYDAGPIQAYLAQMCFKIVADDPYQFHKIPNSEILKS